MNSLRHIKFAVAIAVALGSVACKSPTAGDSHADGEADEHSADTNEAEGTEHVEGSVVLTEEAASRVKIRTQLVEESALSGVLATTGRVDFNQDRLAHVSPRVPGRVHRVYASLGETVKVGQRLVVIDSIELGKAKSAFLQAKAQLALARTTLEREEDLRKDQITSEQSVLEARTAHQSVRAAFQSARQNLLLLGLGAKQIDKLSNDSSTTALYPLSTPIAGTVVEKHVVLGEVVSPEKNLYTVADLSDVWVWIDVYERDLANVHLEDDVILRADAIPGRTFQGAITYIRSQVDPDTRTVRARVDVPNPGAALRAGMFVDVTITDPHAREGEVTAKTMVVPSTAVQRDGDEFVVFVPDGTNRYLRREVRVGRRTDESTEILSGVSPGESVVVEGAFILKSEAAKDSLGGGHEH